MVEEKGDSDFHDFSRYGLLLNDGIAFF